MAGALLCALAMSSMAGAQATQRAATSQPSSPGLTLGRNALAMMTGNASAVHEVYHAENAAEEQLVAAFADMAGSVLKLRTAAESKFLGPNGFDLIGFRAMFTKDANDPEECETVTIEGDVAKIFIAGDEKPRMTMVLVGGEWEESPGRGRFRTPERRIARLRAQAGGVC